MRSYQNYLFDADGTLIDTAELICQSFLHVFNRYDSVNFDRERIIGDMGRPLLEMIGAYFPNRSEGDIENISNVYRNYQLTIFQDFLALFPNVQETLSSLKNSGKRLAVVTSRKEDTAIKFLAHTNILEYFDAVVTPESTRKHKPQPEPALKALELIGGSASETVFVGDSSYDIQCGEQAGMDTIFVGWSQNKPSTFTIRPTFVIDDMKELLESTLTHPPASGW